MPHESARMGRRLAPAILLGLGWILGGCNAPAREPTPTLEPLQILENLRRELIPPEGSPTGYGPTFSTEGYETLRQWNEDIRPRPSWADDYERLDISLTCCAADHPFEDESKNCGCGHHQALYGLAKRLLETGTSVTAVQAEIYRWRAFMFPRETLAAEMERRAMDDPAIRQALDELRQQGIC